MKDWLKSGYEIKVIEALPDYDAQFIIADKLFEKSKQAEANGSCTAANTEPLFTLLDLRTDKFVSTENSSPAIKTICSTINMLFDDLLDPEKRKTVPTDSLVVTVTETGNRDKEAMQFLSKFGYTNVKGLRFGMRGWIKQNYPTTLD